MQESMTDTTKELSAGAKVLQGYLHLLCQPQALYEAGDDDSRRHINQTFYEHFFLDDHGHVGAVLKPSFDELHDAADAFALIDVENSKRKPRQANRRPGYAKAPAATTTSVPNLRDIFLDRGSSKGVLVELPGIEPGSSDAEPRLLRAQSAERLSQPRRLSRHIADRLSRCESPTDPPRPGICSKPP